MTKPKITWEEFTKIAQEIEKKHDKDVKELEKFINPNMNRTAYWKQVNTYVEEFTQALSREREKYEIIDPPALDLID